MKVSKETRVWNGVRVFLHCQRCGKVLPKTPATVGYQLLTRLCKECYKYGGELEYPCEMYAKLYLPPQSSEGHL
jgi:hypothetical protein